MMHVSERGALLWSLHRRAAKGARLRKGLRGVERSSRVRERVLRLDFDRLVFSVEFGKRSWNRCVG